MVALQTRGMVNKKILGHIKTHLITGPLPGAVLFIYPHIPSGAYAAKRTVTGSRLELAAATGASDESGDTDGDSGSDALDEDCQLPEVATKSVTTMSRWEKQAKLAADRFLIDSSLGQFSVRK